MKPRGECCVGNTLKKRIYLNDFNGTDSKKYGGHEKKRTSENFDFKSNKV